MSSSLQGRKKQISATKKSRRGQSVENKQRISFSKQSKDQISIKNIFDQTLKITNQSILSQQNNYRQSMLNLSSQRNKQKIQQMIQSSNGKQQFYNWEIVKIQQKRKIKGIKAKLMWCKNKQNSWIVIRAVLTDNHIQLNEPQYFVQLDSANIDLNIEQQRSIQKSINKEVEKSHEKTQQLRPQIFLWLKNVLAYCHNLFLGMKLNERKKTKQMEFKRYTINQNYILYPCPASLTWNPHGMLCLSENKVSSLSKPIVGSVYSYRNLIQAPYKFQRFARKNNQMNDLKLVDEKRQEEQETTQAQFFGWDVKQQINFTILGRSGEQQIEQPRQSSAKSDNANQKQQKRIIKDHQTFFMGNTNIIPPKLQKIYRRYFTTVAQNTQFQFLQKLKIFIVKNQVAQLQDGISYLIDKIQKFNRVGVVQVLLQNQFTGYHGVFSKIQKQNPKFQRLKYEIVSQFLQQKIKSNPQNQQFLYMKSVILQNQFFRLALEEYIQQNFVKLKIVDRKYQKLGSFDNFDEVNAQKAIFAILQGYLKPQNNSRNQAKKIKSHYANKPQKYDDPKYRQRKYEKMQAQNQQMKLMLRGYVKRYHKDSIDENMVQQDLKMMKQQSQLDLNKILYKQKMGRNVNLNVLPFLVVNKIEFLPFQFNMILTPLQRKSFLESVIPILWIKDRGIQRFQYKLAKRVIIANSKIINFMEKLSSLVNLWKKAECTKKSSFLKTVVNQYHKFSQNFQVPIGKIYYAQCQGCKTDFTAYNIQQLVQVKKCSRCKYLEQVN